MNLPAHSRLRRSRRPAQRLLVVIIASAGCFGGQGPLAVVIPIDPKPDTLKEAPMVLKDEKTFTDDEFAAAFELILPPDEARDEALALNSAPDLHGFETATPAELAAAPAKSARSYDGDLLDLLSLVSDSCAERAWRLLGISSEEGQRRRENFRRRIEPILRKKL